MKWLLSGLVILALILVAVFGSPLYIAISFFLIAIAGAMGIKKLIDDYEEGSYSYSFGKKKGSLAPVEHIEVGPLILDSESGIYTRDTIQKENKINRNYYDSLMLKTY